MFGRILDALISTLRGKIMAFVNLIRRWTSPTYLQSTFVAKIRAFFSKNFTIKPRDKKDYFTIFIWLVSKRLVFMICIVAGVYGIYYLTAVNPLIKLNPDGIRTYSYSSIPLRYTTGEVNIKAKSGYIAYTGHVQKGRVIGEGTLFDRDGCVIYDGEFDNNMYNGEGMLYYDNESLRYVGEFADNIFNGKGRLFRKNGSCEYEGEFINGEKHGVGTLFGNNNKMIYNGNFAYDQVMYTDFVGKSTQEVSGMYAGNTNIYSDENDFVVSMSDIDAVYMGDSSITSLDSSMKVDGIYVLKNYFCFQGKKYTSISELKNILDDIEYEGNSNILLAEAVCINEICNTRESLFENVELSTEAVYDDVFKVNDFGSDESIYLYSFSSEGLQYTFFCADKYGRFDFYLIEKEA